MLREKRKTWKEEDYEKDHKEDHEDTKRITLPSPNMRIPKAALRQSL